MKNHIRILYAAAIVAILAAGLALKSKNDELATKLASASSPASPAAASSASPGGAP